MIAKFRTMNQVETKKQGIGSGDQKCKIRLELVVDEFLSFSIFSYNIFIFTN